MRLLLLYNGYVIIMAVNKNSQVADYRPVLEITVGHWPFSDQFQHLAKQNPFWLTKFTVHFQWDGN